MKKDYKDKDRLKLIEEKKSLECTLLSLSEEVECLSEKNEQFLRELKQKDFYQEYKAWSDELLELRKAHLTLIDLIQGKEITIDQSIHPLTDSLLKRWKHENLLNVSEMRAHSSSTGNINDVSALRKARRGKYDPFGYNQFSQEINGNSRFESSEKKGMGSIFNCGGNDNIEKDSELYVA